MVHRRHHFVWRREVLQARHGEARAKRRQDQCGSTELMNGLTCRQHFCSTGQFHEAQRRQGKSQSSIEADCMTTMLCLSLNTDGASTATIGRQAKICFAHKMVQLFAYVQKSISSRQMLSCAMSIRIFQTPCFFRLCPGRQGQNAGLCGSMRR